VALNGPPLQTPVDAVDPKTGRRSVSVPWSQWFSNFYNAWMTGMQNVQFGDSANLDAFGRLRTSSPYILFDSMTEYGVNPVQWETATTGGSVTFQANQNSARLSTGGTTSGNFAIRQSRWYLRYQPGHSMQAGFVFVMGAAQTNSVSRVGYFDANNGIFLERNGSVLNIVRRTSTSGSPVDNAVAQSAWNIDHFNGTGPSGITLDVTKSNILTIDIDSGAGRIRIGFLVNGITYYVHQFLIANTIITTSMSTMCLPIRYEVRNTGTSGGTLTMDSMICYAFSEGSLTNDIDQTSSIGNGFTPISAASGVYTPLVSLQCKTAGPNSVTNRGHVNPNQFGVTVTGTNPVAYNVILNPATITGASWVSVGTNNIVNYDISATAFTGGSIIASGHVNATNQSRSQIIGTIQLAFPMVYTALGSVQDVIMIVAAGIGGASNSLGRISWTESY
jgi:hypothetical protein